MSLHSSWLRCLWESRVRVAWLCYPLIPRVSPSKLRQPHPTAGLGTGAHCGPGHWCRRSGAASQGGTCECLAALGPLGRVSESSACPWSPPPSIVRHLPCFSIQSDSSIIFFSTQEQHGRQAVLYRLLSFCVNSASLRRNRAQLG